MNNRKKTLIMIVALVLLIAAALTAWLALKPQPSAGSKAISVTVEHFEGGNKVFNIKTDAEYLREALDQEQLVAGNETEYGLWVTTVDGETADDAKQEWWGYTVNGEFAEFGVDQQPVNDGDAYVFTLNVGY